MEYCCFNCMNRFNEVDILYKEYNTRSKYWIIQCPKCKSIDVATKDKDYKHDNNKPVEGVHLVNCTFSGCIPKGGWQRALINNKAIQNITTKDIDFNIELNKEYIK